MIVAMSAMLFLFPMLKIDPEEYRREQERLAGASQQPAQITRRKD